jgi:hypothetical protein
MLNGHWHAGTQDRSTRSRRIKPPLHAGAATYATWSVTKNRVQGRPFSNNLARHRAPKTHPHDNKVCKRLDRPALVPNTGGPFIHVQVRPTLGRPTTTNSLDGLCAGRNAPLQAGAFDAVAAIFKHFAVGPNFHGRRAARHFHDRAFVKEIVRVRQVHFESALQWIVKAINAARRVPTTSKATFRPRTLKFVDTGPLSWNEFQLWIVDKSCRLTFPEARVQAVGALTASTQILWRGPRSTWTRVVVARASVAHLGVRLLRVRQINKLSINFGWRIRFCALNGRRRWFRLYRRFGRRLCRCTCWGLCRRRDRRLGRCSRRCACNRI